MGATDGSPMDYPKIFVCPVSWVIPPAVLSLRLSQSGTAFLICAVYVNNVTVILFSELLPSLLIQKSCFKYVTNFILLLIYGRFTGNLPKLTLTL